VAGGALADALLNMAQYLHIRCVVRTDSTTAHERIHSVSGVRPDGSRWILTQDKAISYIQDGTYAFYIEKPWGQRLDVIVATSANGNYLKTEADREQPDKLLSLPTCPGTWASVSLVDKIIGRVSNKPR
jgi:Protein of unknown function (DUF3892)